ncbi:MAG: nuclear transport factor 2 family protein [Pseudomonadota bacterium]
MTLPFDQLLLADELACSRLCVAFANHLDARRYERVLDLFTDDAVLVRMGNVVVGHAAIRAFLEARPTTL